MKTPKQVEAEIKRRNRQFKKATAAQKRVLIAKDAISRVQHRQYCAVSGVYVCADCQRCDLAAGNINHIGEAASVQAHLISGTDCAVCAKGSLLLSCTVLENQQTGADLQRDVNKFSAVNQNYSNGLQRRFTQKQLNLIEVCFEGWSDGATFQDKFSNSTNCLLAIMRNIVKNSGRFVP